MTYYDLWGEAPPSTIVTATGPKDYRAEVEEEGHFGFSGMPPGTYEVIASHDLYTDQEVSVHVHPNTRSKALVVYGLWVRLLNDPIERDVFFHIATLERVDTIFLQCNSSSLPYFEDAFLYRHFIDEAAEKGMQVVMYLGGVRESCFFPGACRDEHVALTKAMVKFNRENPRFRWAGVIWDIEMTTAWSLYRNYINLLKNTAPDEYPGVTINSERALYTLSMYGMPIEAGDIEEGKQLYTEFDVIELDAYGDTFERSLAKLMQGPTLCAEVGVGFRVGLECDKLDLTHANSSLYEEGSKGYHRLEAQLEEYFTEHFPENYQGQFVSRYTVPFPDWYGLFRINWPSGNFTPGETLLFVINLHTTGYYGTQKARGLEIELRAYWNRSWRVWKQSQIVLMEDTDWKEVTVEITAPEVAVGPCDLRLCLYDLDVRRTVSESRYPLVSEWSNLQALYDLPDLDSLDMEGLEGMVSQNPAWFEGLIRTPLRSALLCSTGWQYEKVNVL